MNTMTDNGENGKTRVSDARETTLPTRRRRPKTTVSASLDAALRTNSLKKFVQTLMRHDVTFDVKDGPAIRWTGHGWTNLGRFGRRTAFFAALARWDKTKYGNGLTLPEWRLLQLRIKTINSMGCDVPRAWFDRALPVASLLSCWSLEPLVDVVQLECPGDVGALLSAAETIIRERENHYRTFGVQLSPTREPARFSVTSESGESISGSVEEWRQVIAAVEASEGCEPSNRLGVRTRNDGFVELYVPSNLPGEKGVLLVPVERVDAWVQVTETLLNTSAG